MVVLATFHVADGGLERCSGDPDVDAGHRYYEIWCDNIENIPNLVPLLSKEVRDGDSDLAEEHAPRAVPAHAEPTPFFLPLKTRRIGFEDEATEAAGIQLLARRDC